MMKTLQKLTQKPKDKTIRITRVSFALLLMVIIYFGWNSTEVLWGLPQELLYAVAIFPLIGLIRGIFDPGIFRKKIWKWTIFGLGIAMIIISLFLIEDRAANITAPISSTSDTIEIATLPSTSMGEAPFTLSIDNWFGFFGFFVALIGFLLNSKNITLKNERYGEIVKKIRV